MDKLISLDHQIFYFINGQLQNSIFNWLCPLLRNPLTWIPLYVILFAFLVYRYKKQSVFILVFAIINVAFTDQISSSIIKPLAHRLRPCNNPFLLHPVHLLIDCGSGFSMCSSHAANHFGMAVFFSFLFSRKYKWVLYTGIIWASIISLSQVYVGVHYPSDITVGAIVGICTGLACGKLCLHFIPKPFNL